MILITREKRVIKIKNYEITNSED